MTWQIWLAIASIIFIVFGLVKRLETRMLLIVAGFILCCASGAPMKAFGAFVKGIRTSRSSLLFARQWALRLLFRPLNVISTSLLQ